MEFRGRTVPTAMLASGVIVANVCSYHPFHFDDGTLLGAGDPVLCQFGKFHSIQDRVDRGLWTDVISHTREVSNDLQELLAAIDDNEMIDIAIVPAPVMSVVQQLDPPFRKVRTVLKHSRESQGRDTICRSDAFYSKIAPW